MIREIDANLITPDKLLQSSDMARLGCNNCRDCSECCRDRAEAITLDPYDIRLLKEGLNYSFEGLLEQGFITLTVVDGVILPALAVRTFSGNSEAMDSIPPQKDMTVCMFLGEDGRCRIHSFRPGICRMFPLARIWHEDGSFSYFLQPGECSRANGVKIRISKWLGYPDVNGYEQFIRSYHDALRSLRGRMQKDLSHEEQVFIQRQFLEEWFTG